MKRRNQASEIDERGMAAGDERGMANGDEEGMVAGDEGGLATNNEHNLKLINRQEVYIDALEIEGKEKRLWSLTQVTVKMTMILVKIIQISKKAKRKTRILEMLQGHRRDTGKMILLRMHSQKSGWRNHGIRFQINTLGAMKRKKH